MLDNKITQQIQDWLNAPNRISLVEEGARLMLSLNRNKALYNSILKNPAKFLPKLEYELRKYLRMRIDNKSVADVVKLESKVMPLVQQSLNMAPVLSSDDELPQASIALGRRKDHDSLPVAIRELWDSNGVRLQRIKILFNELKAMSDMQPCDRYEKLTILDSLDKRYRANLEAYDNYVKGECCAPMGDDDVNTDNERTINNARKTLSKYRKIISGLDASDAKYTEALSKIQSAVDAIMACGAGVSEATKEELLSIGITF